METKAQIAAKEQVNAMIKYIIDHVYPSRDDTILSIKKEGRELPQPVGKELLRAIVDEKITFRHTHPQGAGV